LSGLSFLPEWPPHLGPLPWIALLLLAAVILGEAVQRWLSVPRLLGWVFAGALLGPSFAGIVDRVVLAQLRPLLEVSAGLLLFELGQRVDLSWFERNFWLLVTSVAESLLGFVAVLALLLLLGVAPVVAAAAAGLGIATSPAVVLTLSKELRAQGQVNERLLLLTALNGIFAFVALSAFLAWLHLENRSGWVTVVAHPLYVIAGSTILAGAFALVTLDLLGRLGKHPDAQFVCAFALAVSAVELASFAKLSVPLAMLAFGALTRAFDRHRRFLSLEFGRTGQIFLILLFAIPAAGLDYSTLPQGLALGIALVIARYCGKTVGVLVFARASGLGLRKGALLSLALTPMSAFGIAMLQSVAEPYASFWQPFQAIVLGATVLLELAGPLAARFALVRAGETAE
jgi:Kef-type K+ transport system membrane component KefB